MINKTRRHIVQEEPLVFEISSPGKKAYQLPALDVEGFAIRTGHRATCFDHDQRTGCHVPRLEGMFPVAVEPSTGHVTQVKRRTASPPNRLARTLRGPGTVRKVWEMLCLTWPGCAVSKRIRLPTRTASSIE